MVVLLWTEAVKMSRKEVHSRRLPSNVLRSRFGRRICCMAVGDGCMIGRFAWIPWRALWMEPAVVRRRKKSSLCEVTSVGPTARILAWMSWSFTRDDAISWRRTGMDVGSIGVKTCSFTFWSMYSNASATASRDKFIQRGGSHGQVLKVGVTGEKLHFISHVQHEEKVWYLYWFRSARPMWRPCMV